MQNKLEVNTDYFLTARSKMAYVFSWTGRDAQTHFCLQYVKELVNPFPLKEEIISYLLFIYKDLFKT